MYPIIHFTKMSDLLDEINPHGRHIVRISASQKRITHNGTIPRTEVTVRVLVQALHEGAILVYVPLLERITYSPSYHEADSQRRYNAAWRLAESAKVGIEKIVSDAGHQPRPGIIDLGNVEPVLGRKWQMGSEEEEE